MQSIIWLSAACSRHCRPAAAALQHHAFSSVVSIRTDCSWKRNLTRVSLRDMLPRFGKGEVRMGRLSYDTEERHRIEGGGTVCGKKMLLKIVSLAADPDAAANLLNEMRVYERLAPLQGRHIPVFEAAGLLPNDRVFLAVSGAERINVAVDGTHRALAVEDFSTSQRWGAVDALRKMHDLGVLHNFADSRALHLQLPHGVRALRAFQAAAKDKVKAVRQYWAIASGITDMFTLLWGGFGNATIVPGLTRHSPAAQDEALIASLCLDVPSWARKNLLNKRRITALPQVCPAQPNASLAQMLPAFAAADVQLGEVLCSSPNTAVHRGVVLGRPAVVKTYTLQRPWSAHFLQDELGAYQRLRHLRGSCVPGLLAAGTLHQGRTAVQAMTDGGIGAPHLAERSKGGPALTAEEQAMALEILACIHDSGVLLGSAQLPHILVQRTQDGYDDNRVLWVGFKGGLRIPAVTRRSDAAVAQRQQAAAALQLLQAAANGQQDSAAAMATAAESNLQQRGPLGYRLRKTVMLRS